MPSLSVSSSLDVESGGSASLIKSNSKYDDDDDYFDDEIRPKFRQQSRQAYKHGKVEFNDDSPLCCLPLKFLIVVGAVALLVSFLTHKGADLEVVVP